MDTAEMQQRLKTSLANDRVVYSDDKNIKHLHALTLDALSKSEMSSDAKRYIVNDACDRVRQQAALDKRSLVGFVEEIANKMQSCAPFPGSISAKMVRIRPTPDELLQIKLALCSAFEQVCFLPQIAGARLNEIHRGLTVQPARPVPGPASPASDRREP